MNLLRVLKLELRKHAQTFVGTAIVILLGVTSTVVGGVALGAWNWGLGLVGAISLLIFSIPLIAVLFGAIVGHSLRRDPERSAEEPLPVHPLARVGGAFLAGFLYFVVLAVTLPALFSFDVTSHFAFESPLLVQVFGPLFWLFVLGNVHLYFLSFVFAYWIKQPILGAGLALMIVAVETFVPVLALSDLHCFGVDVAQLGLPYYNPNGFILLILPWFLFSLPLVYALIITGETGAKLGTLKSVLLVLVILCGPISSGVMAIAIRNDSQSILRDCGDVKNDVF